MRFVMRRRRRRVHFGRRLLCRWFRLHCGLWSPDLCAARPLKPACRASLPDDSATERSSGRSGGGSGGDEHPLRRKAPSPAAGLQRRFSFADVGGTHGQSAPPDA
jgi:hypothetical protein